MARAGTVIAANTSSISTTASRRRAVRCDALDEHSAMLCSLLIYTSSECAHARLCSSLVRATRPTTVAMALLVPRLRDSLAGRCTGTRTSGRASTSGGE
ncbi:hypothetical protein ACU4GD_21550 [Cupriavidus basilensis]